MGQILIRKSCDFFNKKTPHFYGCYKISDVTNCVFFIKKKIFVKSSTHPWNVEFGTFKSKYIAKSFKQNLNFKGAIKKHPMNLTGRAVAN